MMKRTLNRLDQYFLSEIIEEITIADRITFYGFYVITFGGGIVLAANLYL